MIKKPAHMGGLFLFDAQGRQSVPGLPPGLQQGGMAVDEEKVTDIDRRWPVEAFQGDGLLIKKGKKVFHRAVVR